MLMPVKGQWHVCIYGVLAAWNVETKLSILCQLEDYRIIFDTLKHHLHTEGLHCKNRVLKRITCVL